ncbi:predicted protein [Histoplasma capsulatum H143]|uniref:Uncharacterized protein n=1 Tax=Ajellomyces capsulatus (strain H143) TaxID=544712 RepID=C6HR46_AJECH|nr:predicted protein [Histoplasma capsulatum H143]
MAPVASMSPHFSPTMNGHMLGQKDLSSVARPHARDVKQIHTRIHTFKQQQLQQQQQQLGQRVRTTQAVDRGVARGQMQIPFICCVHRPAPPSSTNKPTSPGLAGMRWRRVRQAVAAVSSLGIRLDP